MIGKVIDINKLTIEGFNKKAVEALRFLNGNETTKLLMEQSLKNLPNKSQHNIKQAIEGNL